MSLLKSFILFLLLIFSLSPVWAQDTDCCVELRHEVQMIKDQLKSQQNQQINASKELNQQQVTTKTGFKGVGVLVDALVTQFPNLPALKTVKQIFDNLNK
ncbi:hypothetical protein [Rickettsiella endosymbiont of Litargus connexus]|jgi:hypothetical protein|uniref:hypothetical protein n=1 Tax=Rickettsiella endosymbiont of Litargus connexus TaxID=3066237 RepID=UPI0027E892FB|nr:hypothetical protein [Gammaproteobacteria bacterium]MCH9754436.1 hypothetical protein [Gammaproteobacteria bacterium]MDD4893024.1 hypothetical protein [Candidatus Rickettsiella isopodorum]MDD5161837.1 hypothetical protein [Candidatus Rickettsiella isopodorum]MDQ5899410.1 hypothetical protein [Pseudomonadota bacterium]